MLTDRLALNLICNESIYESLAACLTCMIDQRELECHGRPQRIKAHTQTVPAPRFSKLGNAVYLHAAHRQSTEVLGIKRNRSWNRICCCRMQHICECKFLLIRCIAEFANP